METLLAVTLSLLSIGVGLVLLRPRGRLAHVTGIVLLLLPVDFLIARNTRYDCVVGSFPVETPCGANVTLTALELHAAIAVFLTSVVIVRGRAMRAHERPRKRETA